MKAALIAPKGYEHTVLASDIHLVLPLKECRENLAYMSTYREARHRGHYLILDNGCAEGDLVDNDTLMKVAVDLGVHEIVAPDVMGDADKTYDLTTQFLKTNGAATDYGVMAVLQGKNMQEALYLAAAFDKMPQITAFGIPKVHLLTSASSARSIMAETLLTRYASKYKIHLLGLNNAFPTEMVDHRFHRGIRSMDSAQPYKMAEAGVALTAYNARRHHPKRREDYFTEQRPVNTELLTYNIEQFKAWCL